LNIDIEIDIRVMLAFFKGWCRFLGGGEIEKNSIKPGALGFKSSVTHLIRTK